MKNRSRDIPYCGVRKDVIEAAKPTLNDEVLHCLFEFIRDRYEIHVKKDVEKLPAPWTTNPIFQQVKFTNVRREHDRESKNLIENIASQVDVSLKDRFFNIIVMRFWNKYESFKLATGGKLLKFPLSDADYLDCLDRIKDNADHTWWSGAYYTAPVRSWMTDALYQKKEPEGGWNYSGSPIIFAKHMLTDELWDRIVGANSPKEVFEILTEIPWMGGFLVYQWFVDFTYCPDYWFSENEYTVSGPGCTKGINLLFADRDGMNHEECLFWMRDNQHQMFAKFGYKPEEIFADQPPEEQRIGLMSFENLMCELQKYMKGVEALKVGKKPRGKSSYDGLGIKPKKVEKKEPEKQYNLFDLE